MDIELEYSRFVTVTCKKEGVDGMDPRRAFLAGMSAGIDLHGVLASLTAKEFPDDREASRSKLAERLEELYIVSKKYKNAN